MRPFKSLNKYIATVKNDMADNKKYDFVDLTVEKCFKEFYVVPDYQREYVWTEEKEVAQLLNDMYEAYSIDKTKEYFLGTTVVFNNNGTKELIDGQQRTTTLFLTLCAFRNIYLKQGLPVGIIEQHLFNSTYDDQGNEVQKYHLELQYQDSTGILDAIFHNANITTFKSKSAERLYGAYKCICQFIENNTENDTEELKGLFMYFFRQLKFIQIMTPDINDALKIFETINDRGIGLNPMDLLKNLIFRQVERNKFYTLKDKWKTLVQVLESANEKPLRFLRYFIVSNYPSLENSGRKDKEENTLREDEIYQWFLAHSDKCGFEKDPYSFVDLLIENARCYVNFASGKDQNGNANTNLNNLIRLTGNAFKQHIILLLSARKFGEDMFNYLTKSIETYLYYCLFTKEQAKIYEKVFGKWDLTLSTVSTLDGLKEWVDENIKPEITKRSAEYRSRFLVFTQNDLQLYRVRYILAKITLYVDNARLGVVAQSSIAPYLKNGVEIEHILPQTPYGDMAERIKDYDTVKFMLGNLTLIEKSMNDVVKNKPYEQKVLEYDKSPYYLTSTLSKIESVGENSAINRINKELRSYDHWDADTISDRQEMLYQLSLKIWSID